MQHLDLRIVLHVQQVSRPQAIKAHAKPAQLEDMQQLEVRSV
jgi:hypothetical protein